MTERDRSDASASGENPSASVDESDVVDREAARVIVLDEKGRVLLVHGSDPENPDGGSWWLTPGGGVEPGESTADAAVRELREETGLSAPHLEGPVFEQTLRFPYLGRHLRQHQVFFIARVAAAELRSDGWTQTERRVLDAFRWWSVDELRHTDETVYPGELPELIDRYRAG